MPSWSRAEFGAYAVEAEDGGNFVCGCGAVSGEHKQPFDACRAQVAQGAWRVVAQGVAQEYGAGQASVDDEPGGGRAVEKRAVADRLRPARPGGRGPRTADRYLVPVHGAGGAPARFLGDVRRDRERQSAFPGGVDDGLGEDVRRVLVERGRQAEDFGGFDVGRGDHVEDAGAATGESAGLVQQQGSGAAEVLERSAVADDDAEARGAREAGDDRDRSGQQQRTGGWRPPGRRLRAQSSR